MAKKAFNQPYERQEGESAKAFEAFVQYRNMGRERSITKVAQELDKSRALIGRWSGVHNWVERVKAYDQEMDRQELIQHQKEIKSMKKRHATGGRAFQGKALERIQMTDASELSPELALRYYEIGTKIERIAMGEPSEIQQLEHGGEVTQTHEHTIEERTRKYAEMYEKIKGEKGT